MKVLPNSIHLNDHTLGLYPDLKVKTTLYSILNMQYRIKVFLQQLQYL